MVVPYPLSVSHILSFILPLSLLLSLIPSLSLPLSLPPFLPPSLLPLDKIKDILIAKIAMQCSDLYAEAYSNMQVGTIKSIWDKVSNPSFGTP